MAQAERLKAAWEGVKQRTLENAAKLAEAGLSANNETVTKLTAELEAANEDLAQHVPVIEEMEAAAQG